jgi:hypothetical protein
MSVDSLDATKSLNGQSISARSSDSGKRIKRTDLINMLNFINFQDGTILVKFREQKYGTIISIQAKPLPCEDMVLNCLWTRPNNVEYRTPEYRFIHFMISDGQNLIIVEAEVVRMDKSGISFLIPETASELSCRKVKRHVGAGIKARLFQNGVSFDGYLVDFNAVSLRIELISLPTQSFQWINPDQAVQILLDDDGKLLYSGDCIIIRQGLSLEKRWFVLSPQTSNLSRFRKREFRCIRHHTNPPINLSFRHPLSDKHVFLQAVDISSTGLAVDEHFDNSVLLPGMMIPEITLEIANNSLLSCSAQVLYRNIVHSEYGSSTVRCGLVLLDMQVDDQAKLSALLHQALNPKSFVCSQVDPEDLWQFFFESGFIYPSKYSAIESRKADFKRTYEMLYRHSPSIARHFIFQDKGSLFGHMSMLRFYTKAWLIHHHTASARKGNAMAGLTVLEQVSSYLNEFRSLLSSNMNYVLCYYRPDNRFPKRVFGGVTEEMANPKGSSVDTFAYLNLPEQTTRATEPYQLMPVNTEDMDELEHFYENESGGLLLDALDLKTDSLADDNLNEEYRNRGLKRSRQVFSLKQDGKLKVVVMITLSDLGLNLSNLTNCIHCLVLDEEGLDPETMTAALHDLRRHYGQDELPVLVYPHGYLDKYEIPYEKKYSLWIYNMQNIDPYFRFLRKTFRRNSNG